MTGTASPQAQSLPSPTSIFPTASPSRAGHHHSAKRRQPHMKNEGFEWDMPGKGGDSDEVYSLASVLQSMRLSFLSVQVPHGNTGSRRVRLLALLACIILGVAFAVAAFIVITNLAKRSDGSWTSTSEPDVDDGSSFSSSSSLSSFGSKAPTFGSSSSADGDSEDEAGGWSSTKKSSSLGYGASKYSGAGFGSTKTWKSSFGGARTSLRESEDEDSAASDSSSADFTSSSSSWPRKRGSLGSRMGGYGRSKRSFADLYPDEPLDPSSIEVGGKKKRKKFGASWDATSSDADSDDFTSSSLYSSQPKKRSRRKKSSLYGALNEEEGDSNDFPSFKKKPRFSGDDPSELGGGSSFTSSRRGSRYDGENDDDLGLNGWKKGRRKSKRISSFERLGDSEGDGEAGDEATEAVSVSNWGRNRASNFGSDEDSGGSSFSSTRASPYGKKRKGRSKYSSSLSDEDDTGSFGSRMGRGGSNLGEDDESGSSFSSGTSTSRKKYSKGRGIGDEDDSESSGSAFPKSRGRWPSSSTSNLRGDEEGADDSFSARGSFGKRRSSGSRTFGRKGQSADVDDDSSEGAGTLGSAAPRKRNFGFDAGGSQGEEGINDDEVAFSFLPNKKSGFSASKDLQSLGLSSAEGDDVTSDMSATASSAVSGEKKSSGGLWSWLFGSRNDDPLLGDSSGGVSFGSSKPGSVAFSAEEKGSEDAGAGMASLVTKPSGAADDEDEGIP